MSKRSFTSNGIVLKRSNVGETDRVVVLLTQEFGKVVCVAKGVRTLASSKRALLEPGNYIKGFFITTKSLPLLTQAVLLESCSQLEQTLARIKQLTQVLEVFEKLFVEQELEQVTFDKVLALRATIANNTATAKTISLELRKIITELGYQDPKDSQYSTITEYISALSDKPLNSFEFLTLSARKE